MARVVSVNVGKPIDADWNGRMVRSGIWKTPVNGRVIARRLNLDGDGQADLVGHGGEQRALLVYQVASYRFWAEQLGRPPLDWGTFGENLTVEGLPDDEVCIGDRYRIGAALFEVSQPRVTCFKVGMKLGHPQMPALMVAHKRPGFYFRVIEEGAIGAGDPIEKVRDGPEGISVVAMDALLYSSDHPVDVVKRALRIEALSPGWQSSMRSLLEAAERGDVSGNAGLGTGQAAVAWKGYRALKIVRSQMESEEIRSFELADPDGRPLPPFLAGQSIVIKLQRDGRTIIRNYSLSGPPDAATYRIAVKNEHGLASEYLHQCFRAGQSLDVGAPRGTFVVADGAEPVVLLSAGVGVTPMLSMLHALAADDGLSGRDVWWIHSARDRRSHAFAEEAACLIPRHDRRWTIYSRPGPDALARGDCDAVGHLEASTLDHLKIPRSALFYLCGPASYLQSVPQILQGWGAGPAQIHLEAFGNGAAAATIAPHQPDGVTGTGPTVSFARSGLAVPWSDRFANLLELAEACSVPVRWSCRAGVCHSCESGLVAGKIKYDPQPIDLPDAENVLICCAKPTSDIVLDL